MSRSDTRNVVLNCPFTTKIFYGSHLRPLPGADYIFQRGLQMAIKTQSDWKEMILTIPNI